jgi:hypothetical protein
MSKFSFTGPNGEVYDVEGPSGATVEQARAIFDQQISTGGLTGIPIGSLVNAVTQATGGLSAAIAQIGPASLAQALQLGSTINLPDLRGMPIPNPIGVSDFVKTTVGQQNIGSINPAQIQGLIAQTSTSVGQAASAITNTKGLGKFGLNADQLQLSGLIKPGLAEQINLDPSKFTSILSSPTSWTGKLGATDLTSVLGNERLQTTVQQGLMNVNFDQLKQVGAISGTEVASQLGPLLNNATKFGLGNATEWLKTAPSLGSLGSLGSLVSGGGIGGLLAGGAGGAPAALISQMNNFAKSAEFAQAFAGLNADISGGGNPLEAGVQAAKGFTNTVNRSNLNEAVKKVIGNSKISVPDFAPPGTS